ncbi:MAG: PD-(D/E)XK nuclease family protein, partial [Chitinophagales bacterium]
LKQHLIGVLEKYQIIEEEVDVPNLLKATSQWLMLRMATDFDKTLVAKRNAQEKVMDEALKEAKIPYAKLQKSALVKHGKVRLIRKMLSQNLKEALLEKADLEQIRSRTTWVDGTLTQAFDEERFDNYKTGKNLLLKNIIKELVLKILAQDAIDAPIRMVGLEATEYGTELDIGEGRKIAISGIIDRVDQVFAPDGTEIYRILDYKTGNVELNDTATALKPTNTPQKYIEKYFADTKYKAGFQAYLYAWLFWLKNKGANIKIGIYALKSINKGIRYARRGELISDDFFEAFEERLIQLLQELYNKDIPFRQSDDDKAYTYSPYKDLVER